MYKGGKKCYEPCRHCRAGISQKKLISISNHLEVILRTSLKTNKICNLNGHNSFNTEGFHITFIGKIGVLMIA